MTATTWTAELDAKLREMWALGAVTREIGERMGITKNAAIGRAHRLRLPRRPSPIKSLGAERSDSRGRQPSNAAVTAKASIPTPAAPQEHVPQDMGTPAPEELRVTLATVQAAPARPAFAARAELGTGRFAHPCCWPIGEPRTPGFRYCDEPALRSCSCCRIHLERSRSKAAPCDVAT